MTGPYTPGQMDAASAGADSIAGRFDGPPAAPALDPATVRGIRAEAQEAERARLAQEIHDGPAQALANAIFQVEHIERLMQSSPAIAAQEIHRLDDMLRRELAEVRAFINHLRPPVLDELGLDGALRDAAAHSQALDDVPVGVALTAPMERLDDAAQTVVLRIVQEALHNVRKHAGASAVSVSTKVEANTWVLEVRDDGRGFDPAAVSARGRRNFGLQFMRERAELIGARLDVRSQPDGGAIVRLAIPIEGEERR